MLGDGLANGESALTTKPTVSAFSKLTVLEKEGGISKQDSEYTVLSAVEMV